MLEAGRSGRRFLPQFIALAEAEGALRGFYRQRARELAASRWGDVGTCTHEQLLEAGFDPSREPSLDDYEL
jgi:hypothetical protein